MPIPKALAARLAKRGIIKLPSKSEEPEVANNVQEEIIAEDYDDTPQAEEKAPAPPPPPEKFDLYKGWYSCPNKWNVYHNCTPGCQEYWKMAKEIDQVYNLRRLKMLEKYPLPNHWREILDIGMRRYYYWNCDTNLVSWLPPNHPKCQVSVAAAELRKQMAEDRERNEEKQAHSDADKSGRSSDEEGAGPKPVANDRHVKKRKRRVRRSSDEAVVNEKSPPSKEKRFSHRGERGERGSESSGRRRERERKKRVNKVDDADSLDPMDPAAYSECPRGTWASGLPDGDEAKTGVDTTVTGPLFQMRPYPNPGTVLRGKNKDIGPKKPT